MWTQTSALLLLACCLWSAETQSDTVRRPTIWDDPIKFQTKAKDQCTMTITGQAQYTMLRISCRSDVRSYYCDYIGKPHTCAPYNKNPRHYFVQMMWGLRKLQNACQAPRTIRPHMCRKATDESQMVFSQQWQDTYSSTDLKPADSPRTTPTYPDPTITPTARATPKPTTPAMKSNAKKLAEQYCWRSLKGACAYVIGLFGY